MRHFLFIFIYLKLQKLVVIFIKKKNKIKKFLTSLEKGILFAFNKSWKQKKFFFFFNDYFRRKFDQI